MTRKRQTGMARRQQAAAACLRRRFRKQTKLDAAIPKTSPLPLGEGFGVRVEPLRGSMQELGYGG